MKKRTKLCLFLCLLLLGSACFRAAAGEAYTYTVRIYAGAQGSFSDGSDVIVFEDLAYGDRISFSLSEVQLKEGSKYYVKGIREAGLDNSEAGPASFTVTRDIDYVVAYGVMSSAVTYTVSYVDTAGRRLAEDETYYGSVGDKPVVAHIYIEGYQPQAYNLTRTLTKDAADNVFSFEYTKIPDAESKAASSAAAAESGTAEEMVTESGEDAGTTAAEEGNSQEEATSDASETTALNEAALPSPAHVARVSVSRQPASAAQSGLAAPAEILDLDSAGVPAAAAAPEKSPLNSGLIAGFCAAVVAGGVAAAALIKKKKSPERHEA